MAISILQRMRFRVYATGVQMVRQAYAKNGWYGAANVVLGFVSLVVGVFCLLSHL